MTDRAGFSATDAALAGVEIARREPLTVLTWSLVQGLMALPLSLLAIRVLAPLRAELTAARGADPAAAAAVMARLAPLQLVVAAAAFAMLTVIYSAVFRSVLQPQAGGPGRLRLGRDELRVALCLLLLGLLTFAGALLSAVAAGVVAGVLGALAPGLRNLWTVVVVLAAFAGLAFAAVRLSLSPPMSFATGRLTVLGSWRLTRGRFWSLFGAYLIAGMLVIAAEIAVFALFAAVAAPFVGLTALTALFQPVADGAPATSAGLYLAFQAVAALLSGMVTALMAGASAEAYRQLSGAAPAATTPSAASDLPRFGR